MIDIVALADRYTKDKRGSTRRMAREAFIAGAQSLSVALRTEMEIGIEYVKPGPPELSYDREGREPERRRAQCKEAMRKHRAKKKLKEGHQWFTA